MQRVWTISRKIVSAVVFTVALCVFATCTVKADENADAILAQQQYQAALATQQYQAALAAQQQQLALLAQYQAALAAQQQALLAQQYQAALTVQNGFINQHQNALSQAFMLQQMQNLQYQQYKAMIERTGLDYEAMLLDNYQKYQNAALKSFLGYNGY